MDINIVYNESEIPSNSILYTTYTYDDETSYCSVVVDYYYDNKSMNEITKVESLDIAELNNVIMLDNTI